MENAKIYEALAKAQSEFEPVIFDRTNPHFKNKYATLNALETATKPALTRNGLSILQLFRMMPEGDMLLITRLAHTSGEYIDSEYLVSRLGKSDQQIGSSITYGRRFCYGSILCISAEDDDDGEATRDIKQSSSKRAERQDEKPMTLITKEQVERLVELGKGQERLLYDVLKFHKVSGAVNLPANLYDAVVKELTRPRAPSALAGV